MSSEQVVLVHGAWHRASCWDRVVGELDHMGISATAVELPLTGFADDVTTAREAIEAAGPDTVVVGHSYGGAVISAAASGVETVGRLVYVAALLMEPGEDPFEMTAGSMMFDAMRIDEGSTYVDPAMASAVFYGDADPDTADVLVADLRPMIIDIADLPDLEPAWHTVPATYLVCTNDQALPPASQRKMAQRASQVVEWPSDHSPFITRPKAVADLIAGHAR